MNRSKRIISMLLATGMILAVPMSAVRAEKEVADPNAQFITDISPNASGTKVSASLTVAYDSSRDDPRCVEQLGGVPFSSSGILLNNMFVVATLQKGNTIKPFNRDFSKVAPIPVLPPPPSGFPQLPAGTICFDDQRAQLNYVLGLIRDQAIPDPLFFGPCGTSTTPACPVALVKSVTNFLTSGNGAYSVDIELAVK